jgi:HAD superfamily hydrolase (TIGR01509 family)
MSSIADRPVLLLDADGNLFPSEEPAFEASAGVTNRFLASLGVETRYTAEYLLAHTTGKNFRTTARDLAIANGVAVEPRDAAAGERATVVSRRALDDWVAEEKTVVSRYLGEVLRPDPGVLEPLRRLASSHVLAAVSSSALTRLDNCFRATGLAELLPAGRRFSAEDSLPSPASKPDPAVYRCALDGLAVAAEQALAVEDSVPGVQAAVAAGIPTIGNLTFVPQETRAARRRLLFDAGARAVVESWAELADDVLGSTVRQ